MNKTLRDQLMPLRQRWYWFLVNNNLWALLACFLAGVLVGLWAS